MLENYLRRNSASVCASLDDVCDKAIALSPTGSFFKGSHSSGGGGFETATIKVKNKAIKSNKANSVP